MTEKHKATDKPRIPGWAQLLLLGLLSACGTMRLVDVWVPEVNAVLDALIGALFVVLAAGGGAKLLARFPQLVARKGVK